MKRVLARVLPLLAGGLIFTACDQPSYFQDQHYPGAHDDTWGFQNEPLYPEQAEAPAPSTHFTGSVDPDAGPTARDQRRSDYTARPTQSNGGAGLGALADWTGPAAEAATAEPTAPANKHGHGKH